METPETFFLMQPDGARLSLERLPTSRESVIHRVQQAWAGPGEYAFVREVCDPECGALDITEIALTAYPDSQLGITRLTPASAALATSDDIFLYLRANAGDANGAPLQLSVSTYEDSPHVWLCLEAPSGGRVAEFGLEVRDRFYLSGQSESSARAIYVCEVPTCRSVFRFISIACEAFRCDYVRCLSYPLNSTSADWFL
jgi:hypothetical protein